MSEQEVCELMASSRSDAEWDANADEVKRRCGGNYPEFWFRAIVMSGVMHRTTAKWDKE